ncbi:hypothetical protein SK128_026782, partial [Halocaridina rubra]
SPIPAGIVLASQLGSDDCDEAVALGVPESNSFERTSEALPPTPSVTPSPSVQIVVVQQERITYKFTPLAVAKNRAICNNSGGHLELKKKSGPSGRKGPSKTPANLLPFKQLK